MSKVYTMAGGGGGGITPTGNINITTTAQVDVTNYATAQVVDSDLVSANIVSGVEILGVSGSAVVPSGSTNITANGTHDVTNYASAVVNVSPSLTTLTATANGTYTPSGYDGYSSVSVSIPVWDGTVNYS